MPELPEVETVMSGLKKVLLGRRIRAVRLARADLRLPFPPGFEARLAGRRVERFERRAKYILAHLDSGEALLLHLGMSGRFTVMNGAGRALGLESSMRRARRVPVTDRTIMSSSMSRAAGGSSIPIRAASASWT